MHCYSFNTCTALTSPQALLLLHQMHCYHCFTCTVTPAGIDLTLTDFGFSSTKKEKDKLITPTSHSTYPYRKHYHYHCDILLFLTPTTPSTHHYREHYNYRCHHPLPPYGYLPHKSSPPHATPHHYRPHYHYRYHLTLPPCGYHTSYYTHLPNHYRLYSPRLHPPCLPPMQCCYPLPSLEIVPGSRSRKGAF